MVLSGPTRKEDFEGELAEVERDVEHLAHNAIGVGEEREGKIADVVLETRQFFDGSRPDADD